MMDARSERYEQSRRRTWKRESARNVTLTPKMAGEFLAINDWPGQRPASRRWVTQLAGYIKHGGFTTARVAIAENAEEGGRRYLVDGQQCCQAVVDAGEPVSAFLETFSCPTTLAVGDLYSRFNRERGRGMADVLRSRRVGTAYEAWEVSALNLCAAALAFVEKGEQYVMFTTKDERAALVDRHPTDCQFVRETCFNGYDRSEAGHLRRTGVAAAMVETRRLDPAAAAGFWARVRDGEGAAKGSPEWKLRNYLMTVVTVGGRAGIGAALKRTNTREMYAKCVHAWNAFRAGRTTDLKYWARAELPKPRK